MEDEATLALVMASRSTALDPGIVSQVEGGFKMAMIGWGVRAVWGTSKS